MKTRLTVALGKTYRTRSGQEVRIIDVWPSAKYPFVGLRKDGSASFWNENGRCDCEQNPEDLVKEDEA